MELKKAFEDLERQKREESAKYEKRI